jgi:hypothetical protein
MKFLPFLALSSTALALNSRDATLALKGIKPRAAARDEFASQKSAPLLKRKEKTIVPQTNLTSSTF